MRSASMRGVPNAFSNNAGYSGIPDSLLTTDSKVSAISVGSWMGINTCSRNDRARPSQKNSRFQAKLIKAMDCRVPNWP